MMRYFDMTNTEGCIGFIPENGEQIVLAGVSVNAMPLSVKTKEWEAYAQFARDYGVHFIFADDIPPVDFYSIPRLDIAATDSEGGFIASVGEPFSLRDSAPLVYISKDRKCFLITDDSTKFLSIAACWKGKLRPYDGVTLYRSKEEARKHYLIEDVDKMPEYKRLMELIHKA